MFTVVVSIVFAPVAHPTIDVPYGAFGFNVVVLGAVIAPSTIPAAVLLVLRNVCVPLTLEFVFVPSLLFE